MQDYQKQAADFLAATDTTIEIVFSANDYHFAGDKERRDIYDVTVKRGSREFKLKFGNSLNDSGFYYTMGRRKVEIDRKKLDWERSNLLAFVRRESSGQFLNNGKSDIIHYPKAPDAYSILACLTKYDPGTFENFCSDLGYDTDSRTAKKTYKAVCKEWLNVSSIWTDSEIEQLQEIQ